MTKWVVLVFTLLLSVVTMYSLNTVDRFYVEKEQLLRDNQFLFGGTHWEGGDTNAISCLLYTSPSPRDGLLSRMPSSA